MMDFLMWVEASPWIALFVVCCTCFLMNVFFGGVARVIRAFRTRTALFEVPKRAAPPVGTDPEERA